VRIAPADIRKKGKVPKNGSLFFTIFPTFMSGPPKDGKPSPYFGEYPPDFFDFIVVDECHRGGANDESNWRGILDYFAPAVQLGLTATPKREENVDTYRSVTRSGMASRWNRSAPFLPLVPSGHRPNHPRRLRNRRSVRRRRR